MEWNRVNSVGVYASDVTSQPLFLQAWQSKCPQPLLTESAFQPFCHLHCLPLDAFYMDSRTVTKYSREDWAKWNALGKITCFDQLVMLCFMHPKMSFILLDVRTHCCIFFSLLTTSTPRLSFMELLSLTCLSHSQTICPKEWG